MRQREAHQSVALPQALAAGLAGEGRRREGTAPRASCVGRAWFAEHGVRVERVMSDNGVCYRAAVHATACRELGIRHLFIRPYRPRTNNKAERFIQTMLREWAYAAIDGSCAERTARLPAGSSATTGEDHTAASTTGRPVIA